MKCCANKCLEAKEALLEKFVHSVALAQKDSITTNVLTTLAVSGGLSVGKRHRTTNVREHYTYVLPYCGEVSKAAFQACYEISNDRLNNLRRQVREGNAFAPVHKNQGNKNASSVNVDALVCWFRSFVEKTADHSTIRFRRQETEGSTVIRFVVRQRVAFLPAFMTWESLHKEYESYLMQEESDLIVPSLRSFCRLLHERPDVRIRSPLSNVCDVCSIYNNVMATQTSALDGENAAMHALDARAMREQYWKDAGSVSSVTIVCTIDYAQNVSLPHVASQPLSWYFLSLITVAVFGVFNENTKKQTNFVVSERAAAKGSNEVASMLELYARSAGVHDGQCGGQKTWTIYADNCGGQNKNNHILRYLLFLVDPGRLKAANIYFFVRGHTKNGCDRGFANMRKAYVKRDLYTMQDVTEMINNSSTTNEAVCLEDRQHEFKDWKEKLEPLYKDIKGIQKYQLFSMVASAPGVVYCRKRPTSEPSTQIMRRDPLQLVVMEQVWSTLKPVQPPPINAEKVTDLSKEIVPFIPEAHRTNPLYRAPTIGEAEAARAKKKKCKATAQTAAARARRVASGETKRLDTPP